MTKKTYLSNISKRWPLEKQKALLGDCEREYLDKLGPTALKKREAASLKQRADLLRPTSRKGGEIIEVASFQVLAWNTRDFCDVIAAATARGATLRALDTGRDIVPHEAAAAVAREVEEFTKIIQARGMGRAPAEIAEERRQDTERRIALIKPFWHLREPSTRELLAMAGPKKGKPMAPATAKAHLGSRRAAQADYEREQNREAGRAAARAKKKGTPNG